MRQQRSFSPGLCVPRRADRTGFPEVIWGANKSPLQIVTILRKLAESDDVAVATRVDQQARPSLRVFDAGLHKSSK